MSGLEVGVICGILGFVAIVGLAIWSTVTKPRYIEGTEVLSRRQQ